MPGFFATFEGGEGAGKGSVIAALAEDLAARGLKPLATREPGGSEDTVPVRALLVQRGWQWTPTAELLLMMADRAQHVAGTIRPALALGQIVLCDRFGASSFAYQGAGKGLPTEDIASLQKMAAGDTVPDLTVLLDVPPQVGLARSMKRLAADGSNESRFEALELAFHERVRASFLEQARQDPKRWVVIDASQPLAEVIAQVRRTLFPRLGI